MLKGIFKNLKTTYLIFTSVVIVFFLLFLFLQIRSFKYQKRYIDLTGKISEYRENIKNLKTSVTDYKLREHPEDLFIYKKDNYSEKVHYYINTLKTINNNVFNNSEKFFDINIKFNENKDIINEIEDNFNLLNENYIKIGNSNNGYLKQIKTAEDKILKLTKLYPSLNNQFKDLIKAKEILLTAGTQENETDFLKKKDAFLKNIRRIDNLFSATNEKQILKNHIAEWINTVLNCRKLKKINGNNFYRGLFDKIFEDIEISENIMTDVVKFYTKEQTGRTKNQFIYGILLIFIITGSLIFIFYIIFKSFKKETDFIIQELNKSVKTDTKNKINEFEIIKNQLQNIKKENEKKALILKQIAKNEFSNQIVLSSNDVVSKSIEKLINSLSKKQAELKEKNRVKYFEERNKDGMIKFGKIMRQHFGNIDNLSFNLLTELVRFLKADIGGIYIVNKKNNPDFLILRASYAYDEKKIIQKEIKLGDGLVGTCAIDKSSVYIDRINDDYIKIVSGFGHTKPKSLLLSPIFVEEKIYGVIELASSRNFSEDDITFVETLSEDIAYTLAYLLK